MFKSLSVCSAGIAGMVLVAGIVAGHLDRQRHHVSLAPDFHISLSRSGLHFYSDEQYGPYGGSILGIADNPHCPVTTGLTLPGVYYRHIQAPQGSTLMWTLSIWLLYLFIPFAVLPSIWIIRWFRSSGSVAIDSSFEKAE